MSNRDIAITIAVMFVWGFHFVVIRIGALEIPPFLLMSLRCALCGLIFLPFASRLSKIDLKNIALYALTFQGLHMTLLFAGLAQVDAGIGSLFMKTGIPFSIIIGWLFYNEKFGTKTTIGLITAFSGCALMLYSPSPSSNVTLTGIALLTGSALFWAVGSVRLKHIKLINFPTMISYAFLIPLPLCIFLSLTFESNQLETLKNSNHMVLAAVLAYQVGLLSFSHYCWKNLIGRNPIYILTPFSILTPLFAILGGVLILHEDLSTGTLLGGVIALIGVTIIALRKRQKAIEDS